MALDQSIQVTFVRVDIRKEGELWGPSEWTFAAKVAGNAVGDSTAFPVARKVPVDLPEATWSTEMDVSKVDKVLVEFQATAINAADTKNLGTVKWTNRFPFRVREEVLANKYFAVTVRVELKVEGGYGPHGAGEIFATRMVSGHPIFSTVSGKRIVPRLEFCEVRPTPSDGALPVRPKQVAGAGPAVRNGKGRAQVSPTDPINFILNPSVIPVLATADADATTAACVEYTYYRPKSLDFKPDDDRLEWRVKSLADGGDAGFVGKPNGLSVHVYGKTAGEVLLECAMHNVVLAAYRALVRPVRKIVCRFNILNGPPGAMPRATPEHVHEHMKIANIFLRQLGLELSLDTDPATSDGAVVTAIPGIFRITVPAGRTSGIAVANFPRCTRMNYRPNVLNFAYIHSDADGYLGMATDIPANKLGTKVTDQGAPSTSWKKPSGIAPDKAPKKITMRLFAKKQRSTHPDLFAMYVTDGNGNPGRLADQLTYANTVVHELGHILGLRHRVGAGHDGLLHPANQNLMHGTNPATLAQDFDIIQARAAHESPAVA